MRCAARVSQHALCALETRWEAWAPAPPRPRASAPEGLAAWHAFVRPPPFHSIPCASMCPPCAPWPGCSYLPNVGMVTIIMNDRPYLKYALIGLLGLLVITNKET